VKKVRDEYALKKEKKKGKRDRNKRRHIYKIKYE